MELPTRLFALDSDKLVVALAQRVNMVTVEQASQHDEAILVEMAPLAFSEQLRRCTEQGQGAPEVIDAYRHTPSLNTMAHAGYSVIKRH